MAIVIDGLTLLKDKRRLPTEAFFVDTNIIIAFEDPFGRSMDNPSIGKRNEEVSQIVLYLKSLGFKSYTTITVALEYYKHIQVGFFNIHTGRKQFDLEEFKRLRDGDLDFMTRWDHQIKVFRKVFQKKFPFYTSAPDLTELVSTFEGGKVDFGDHALFWSVMSCADSFHCIFSNDADFCAYPDELYLLTTNPRIIRNAKAENKLYKSAS
jgi:hypothetical protein